MASNGEPPTRAIRERGGHEGDTWGRQTPRDRYRDVTIFRRLARQARPCAPHIWGLLLLSLLAAPLTLLTPLPLKIVVDSILGTRPLPHFLGSMLPASISRSADAMLLLAAALTIASALLLHLQGSLTWLLQTYVGERMTLDFRAALFAKVQHLSLSYHDSRGTADSLYRIQYDALSLKDLVINGFIPLVSSLVTLLAMLGVATRIDPEIALVALAVIPILFSLITVSRNTLRHQWLEVKELEKTSLSVVQNALGCVRLVKSFNGERHEVARFAGRAAIGMRRQVKVALLGGVVDVLVGLVIATGTVGVLVIGVGHVRMGLITLGDLLVLMVYLAQLYAPLASISKRVATMQSSLASAERALRVLDEAADVPESPNARPLTRARGHLSFRSVSFAYDGRPVLDSISLDIPAGWTVGIVGTTGAGKTTIVQLLTRFYDPTSGSILLDSVDFRDYRVADLRDQVALVLQDPLLLPTTVSENISYGSSNASPEAIEAAARAAGAHEFISRLPNGYVTQVGERGMQLSGGERQRISLARAILKDAPILVLDEPTSAVDADTEEAIMQSVGRVMLGRTTILITHRPSILRSCDLVLEVDRGKLIQRRQPESRA
jgi:ATP-binding cassette subfamily B protein